MYKTSLEPVKEIDLDLNDEIYNNYFGGAWNKIYFEKMCEFYSRLGTTKYTALRHSNIYGPYDKYNLQSAHVFAATINKIINNKSKQLTIWGDGSEKRDFLHVSDMINAIYHVIKKQKMSYKLYNIGYGKAYSVNDLVKKMLKITGRDLNIIYDLDKPTNKISFCLNCNKAMNEIQWRPKISIEDGIKSTVEWFKINNQ